MPELNLYRAYVRISTTSSHALVWVRAEEKRDADALLKLAYGAYLVNSSVERIRPQQLETYSAKIRLDRDTYVLTAISAKNKKDAEKQLIALYGDENVLDIDS